MITRATIRAPLQQCPAPAGVHARTPPITNAQDNTP
jgi:hypothetical protein